MNRGPRVGGVKDPEDTSTTTPPLAVISTGDTFVFFVNSITFSGSGVTPLMPADRDWLSAFSVVELLIAPRHIDSALGGRILNVKCIRPSTIHIDSFFQSGVDNVGLPFTAEEGGRRSTERRELYPALSKDLEPEKTVFLVKGSTLTHAYMGEIPVEEKEHGPDTDMALLANPQEYVKVCVGNMSSLSQCDYIDIKMDLIKTQTNTLSVEHGCAFLDVAFALGAVNLVVFFDTRWSSRGSCYRAIPVIDTNILLAVLKNVRSIHDGYATVVSVLNGVILKDEMGEEITTHIPLEKEDCDDDDEDTEQTASILSLKTETHFDDGILQLKVKVTAEDTSTTRDYKECAPNSSLSIVGLGIGSSKAYPFAFDVVCSNPSDNIPGIVQAFMSRGQATGGGTFRKRKAVKMCL